MKVKENTEPVSAFTVYSKRLKQKKKSKPLKNAGVNKVGVELEKGLNSKKLKQLEEIGMILKQLSKKSKNPNSPSLLQSIEKSHYKLRNASKNILQEKKDKNLNNKNKGKNPNNEFFVESKVDVESDSSSTHIPLLVPIQDSVLTDEALKTHESEVEVKQTHGTNDDLEEVPKVKKPRWNRKLKGGFIEVTSEPNTRILTNGVSSKRSASLESKPSTVSKTKLKVMKKTKTESDLPQNSSLIAKNLFEWLVAPVKEQDFMRDYWEKQPLLIQRPEHRSYFSELLSTPIIDRMLRENNIFFTKHLDVTSYSDGVRETHNPLGRAQANVVWDFYSNGCSVRLLNPQAFVPKIHALNSTLQEYFGCFVGANVYLTPPNSQGFAPHYDDIEAFVLQIEGKKHWKVYKPRNEKEVLPRLSSRNFAQEEIGEPMLDVVLEPGDMLYFPRGFIHQATTVDNEHSLHITLSAYQKTAWVDLLEKTLPIALKRAAAEDVEFRRGLPRDYLGIENLKREKKGFLHTALGLMKRLEHYLIHSLGAGVDQMGAQFMHDALPPVFAPEEMSQSALGGGLRMETNGKLSNPVAITLESKIRFIRPNICRLVEEEDEVRLYHCLDNPLEYHSEEPQFLILPPEGVKVVTMLSQQYPVYVSVESIPHSDPDALLALLSDLWDSGLLVVSEL